MTETGERGLGVLATAQRGVAHRRQLRALGLSDGSIAHRVHAGRLYCFLPSVFAVGHRALPVRGPEVAALLHAGDDAVLSHRTAAALWGLPATPTRLEVTVIGHHLRDLPRLRAYRVSALDLRDVRIYHGLPVTAPARTMIDFAAEASIDELIATLAEARVRRLGGPRPSGGVRARPSARAGTQRGRLHGVSRDLAPALRRAGRGRGPPRPDPGRRPMNANPVLQCSAVSAAYALDRQLLVFARTRGHGPRRDRLARAFSRTGEHAACWLVLGAGGALIDRPRRARWLRGAAVVALAYAINYVVKLAVGRVRPQLEGLAPLSPVVSRLSFPSAHATTSFAAARAFRGLVPGPVLDVTATAFAITRPYLGVHYPSDVVAGAVLGTAVGVTSCR